MKPTQPGAVLVAMVLAIGMCTALNIFVIGIMWDALFGAEPGLSENGTQVLTGWGGGIIGIIGAVIGYNAGTARQATPTATLPQNAATAPPAAPGSLRRGWGDTPE